MALKAIIAVLVCIALADVIGQQLAPVYNGCGQSKGCFGLPDPACVLDGTCSALVTYAPKQTDYEFELWSPNVFGNVYVAVGLSQDSRMGDDSVTECTHVNGKLKAFMSYNDPAKFNTRLTSTDSANGIIRAELSMNDGNLYCRFTRQGKFTTVGGKTFDLSSPHFLLLSKGSASENGLDYHGRNKAVSGNSVKLGATAAVVASDKGTLVKLHGIFMVTAWLIAASLGIILARYFRLTWVGKQFMGKDLWFVFHVGLMSTTWTLTMLAVVFMLVELGGWTSVPASVNPHAVVGIVTTLLAFVQPIMAAFRPHPGAPKRNMFNWAHRFVGGSAQTLAIYCIFRAVDLDKAAIPRYITWVLVAYVVVLFLTHVALTVGQQCLHKDDNVIKGEDAKGSKYRIIVLSVFVLLTAVLVFTIIGTIANGPWPQ